MYFDFFYKNSIFLDIFYILQKKITALNIKLFQKTKKLKQKLL